MISTVEIIRGEIAGYAKEIRPAVLYHSEIRQLREAQECFLSQVSCGGIARDTTR